MKDLHWEQNYIAILAGARPPNYSKILKLPLIQQSGLALYYYFSLFCGFDYSRDLMMENDIIFIIGK